MNSTDGTKVKSPNYPAELVFGAACAAQRINGDYVKPVAWPDKSAEGTVPKTANRHLMSKLLAADTADTGDFISEDDITQGREVRKYFQGLTFKIIQGQVLGDFDRQALDLSSKDALGSNYEIAVVASFPSSFIRGQARDKANNRAKFATGGFIGQVGDKVTVSCEILRCVFSQQWNTYYATAITDNDQALFFATKVNMSSGDKVTVTGNVKKHGDNSTQLNRAKIIK